MTTDLPIAVRVYPDLKPRSPSARRRSNRRHARLRLRNSDRQNPGADLRQLSLPGRRALPRRRPILRGRSHARTSATCWNATRASIRPTPIRAAFPSAASRAIRSSGCCRSRSSARCSTAWRTKGAGCSSRLIFPFDASRCALGYVESRDRFLGGFTFQFFQYRDQDGQLRAHPYRPGIAVKHMDSKRALKGFTGAHRSRQGRSDSRRPTSSPRRATSFAGTCSMLRRWPLRSPTAASRSKRPASSSASSTASRRSSSTASLRRKYIDYNRRDVLATIELAAKLLAEYALHPIELQVTKAYSPASIGKAYLQAMGVTPIMARMPDFPKRYLRLCGIGILRRPCERARAQGSGAGRLHAIFSVNIQHGERADGALALRDGEGDSRDRRLPRGARSAAARRDARLGARSEQLEAPHRLRSHHSRWRRAAAASQVSAATLGRSA